MDVYLDRFLNGLFCTSWLRVKTGWEGLWICAAPIELRQLADNGKIRKSKRTW